MPVELRALPATVRHDVEALLRDVDEPFSRAQPAHLTASALVLDAAREKVLLVHHAKLGRWLQPGGHVDAGDASMGAAALREAREETGLLALTPLGGPLDLDRHPAPCRPDGEHLDVLFACTSDVADPLIVSPESHDVRWFRLDALPDDAVAGLAARLTAARQAVSSTR